MARTRKLEGTLEQKLRLPATLIARVSLLLWSDAHGRVPHGELSKFYERAAEAELDRIEKEMHHA